MKPKEKFTPFVIKHEDDEMTCEKCHEVYSLIWGHDCKALVDGEK